MVPSKIANGYSHVPYWLSVILSFRIDMEAFGIFDAANWSAVNSDHAK